MHYSELRLYLTDAQASPDHFKHMLKNTLFLFNEKMEIVKNEKCMINYLMI